MPEDVEARPCTICALAGQCCCQLKRNPLTIPPNVVLGED